MPDVFSCRVRAPDVLLADFVTAVRRQDSERGYSLIAHAILETQLLMPHLRRRLGTAWGRAWAWHLEKPLRMCAPLFEPIVDAILIFGLVNGFCTEPQLGHLRLPFAVLARMAYFGLLHPREGFHFIVPISSSPPKGGRASAAGSWSASRTLRTGPAWERPSSRWWRARPLSCRSNDSGPPTPPLRSSSPLRVRCLASCHGKCLSRLVSERKASPLDPSGPGRRPRLRGDC